MWGFKHSPGINAAEAIAVKMLEKLTKVLGDGQWRSTAELLEQVGHRFSATLHRAVKEQGWQAI